MFSVFLLITAFFIIVFGAAITAAVLVSLVALGIFTLSLYIYDLIANRFNKE